MRLTDHQREVMEAWLADNMMMGKHTATWAAEQLAPLLGLGVDVSRDWGTLHPLASEVRRWCRDHGAKPTRRMEPPVEFGWERRKAEGWTVNPAHEVECIRCGIKFQTNRRNAKRCPDCIAKGLDAHPRRGADAYGSRKCATCGKEFSAKSHNHKYCSPACKAKADAKYKREWWRRENGVDEDSKRI